MGTIAVLKGVRPPARLAHVFDRSQSTLLLNGVANAGSAILNSILGFIVVPVLLGVLSAEMYGLWVTAASLAVLANCLSFGLRWSLVREVAAAKLNDVPAGRFLNSAASLLVVMGMVGAALIAGCGLWVASGLLTLSDGVKAVAPTVFGFVGLMFFADLIGLYPMCILQGLQQFVSLNAVLSVAALVRAGGVIVLAMSSRPETLPVVVPMWWCLVSFGTAVALNVVTRRLAPHLTFRPARLVWSELRPHVAFGMVSQANSAAGWVLWQSGVWILSLTAGPASAATYSIGQRIPSAAQLLYWRNADVLFPMASGNREQPDLIHASLATVTRTNLAMTLPLCAVCWLFASQLLQIWIGSSNAEAVWVLRFTALAILADATAAGASQVVWALGFARQYLYTYTSVAVFTAVGTVVAARLQGPSAAAAVLFVGVGMLAITFLGLASKYLDKPAISFFTSRRKT